MLPRCPHLPLVHGTFTAGKETGLSPPWHLLGAERLVQVLVQSVSLFGTHMVGEVSLAREKPVEGREESMLHQPLIIAHMSIYGNNHQLGRGEESVLHQQNKRGLERDQGGTKGDGRQAGRQASL